MAPGAVSTQDVDHLPIDLKGKKSNGISNGDVAKVEDIQLEEKSKTNHVLNTFRCLIADLCHQFGCGHPG